MKKPSDAILEIAEKLALNSFIRYDDPKIVLKALILYLDQEYDRLKPEPIRCPVCTESCTTHKIVKRHRGGVARGLYYEPIDVFDEDGREHFHDIHYQNSSSGYQCSNGHDFTIKNITPCWCGWNGDEKVQSK